MLKSVEVEGIGEYVYLNRLDQYGKLGVRLCNLSDEGIKALKSIGLGKRVHEDEDEQGNVGRMGSYIAVSTKTPQGIVDAEGNPYDFENNPVPGTGSKLKVRVMSQPYSNDFGKGNSAKMGAVTVLEAVEFEGGNDPVDTSVPKEAVPVIVETKQTEEQPDTDFDAEDFGEE